MYFPSSKESVLKRLLNGWLTLFIDIIDNILFFQFFVVANRSLIWVRLSHWKNSQMTSDRLRYISIHESHSSSKFSLKTGVYCSTFDLHLFRKNDQTKLGLPSNQTARYTPCSQLETRRSVIDCEKLNWRTCYLGCLPDTFIVTKHLSPRSRIWMKYNWMNGKA